MQTEPRPDAGRGIGDDEIYSPPPTHSIVLFGTVAVLVLVAVAGMLWWNGEAGVFDQTSVDDRATVPDLQGMTEPEALSALDDAGLDAQVEQVLNVDVDPGLVISQTPREGSLLDPGEIVSIATSLGSGFVQVPVVTGTIADRVGDQLATYGLVVGAVSSRTDMGSTVGEVLEQSPAAGAYVIAGAPIDLVVSEGPPPVEVPDVRGDTESAATVTLTDLGFTVKPVRVYSGARRGTVVSSNPPAETEAAFGSQIRIFVSRGPAPVTTPSPTAPPSPVPPVSPPATTPPTPPPDPGGGGG